MSFVRDARKTYSFLRQRPRYLFSVIIPHALRGTLIRLRYLFNPKITIGANFMPESRVRIMGPGKVRIGKNVSCFINSLEHVTIMTTNSEALVEIGDSVALGGVRILCARHVKIGSRTICGQSYISDVDFPDDSVDQAERIEVGEQCWLSGNVGLLKGSRLGRGSTLGVGAVLDGSSVGDYFLAIGNPARAVLKVR